jgi:hypothetical protein
LLRRDATTTVDTGGIFILVLLAEMRSPLIHQVIMQDLTTIGTARSNMLVITCRVIRNTVVNRELGISDRPRADGTTRGDLLFKARNVIRSTFMNRELLTRERLGAGGTNKMFRMPCRP